MPDATLSLLLSDTAATVALGRALASAFREAVAARGAVLYLEGELGSGKTTCARGLLQALGVTGVIRSPTYTLVDTYEVDGLTCVHVDLYRLQSPGEVDELGLRDCVTAGSLVLIEWPRQGGAAVPEPDLVVGLEYFEAARRARLLALTEIGRYGVGNLVNDTSLNPYVSNLT